MNRTWYIIFLICALCFGLGGCVVLFGATVAPTLYAHRFGSYIILNYPGEFTLQGRGSLETNWSDLLQSTDAVTMPITDTVTTNGYEIALASDYINPAGGCVGFNLYVNGVLANTTTMDSQTINGHPTFGAIVPPGSYACCVTWFGTNGVESPYSQTVLASAKPVTSHTAQFWRASTP